MRPAIIYRSFTVLNTGVVVNHQVSGSAFVCKDATYPFEMAIDDGEWFLFNKGLRFTTPTKFSKLSFRLPSGTAGNATVVIYAGNDAVVFDTSFTNVSVVASIAPADVLSITPAAAVVGTGHEYLAGVGNYNGKRSVSIVNKGVPDILVNGVALQSGDGLNFAVERRNDTLNNIQVDATGSTALVGWSG